jgi:serpin B
MGWHQGKGFQSIELPFAGDELTLLVVLPEKADGLPALMEKLTASTFDQIVNNMTEQSIDLSLPKFTARKSFSLKPALTRLGLASAFGAQANFSGMLQSRGKSSSSLSIDDVIHEAVLEVSERGAEGAAATAVVMMRSAMPVKPRVVRVDRPFLFAVRDRAQGGMLFLGTVANPM